MWDSHVNLLVSASVHSGSSRVKSELEIWIWKWSECKLKYVSFLKEGLHKRACQESDFISTYFWGIWRRMRALDQQWGGTEGNEAHQKRGVLEFVQQRDLETMDWRVATGYQSDGCFQWSVGDCNLLFPLSQDSRSSLTLGLPTALPCPHTRRGWRWGPLGHCWMDSLHFSQRIHLHGAEARYVTLRRPAKTGIKY